MIDFDIQNFFFTREGQRVSWSPNTFSSLPPQASYFPYGMSFDKAPLCEVNFAKEFSQLEIAKLEFGKKRVLNIGCREGFFAHYAISKGATEVLALEDAPKEIIKDTSFREVSTILGQECAHSYINLKTENIKAIHGCFNIVIASDLITRYESPFDILRAITECASDQIWILSHTRFISDDLPCTYLYRNYDLEPHYRHRTVPNASWILNALDQLGFKVETGKYILEGKYISLLARRVIEKKSFKPLTYSQLPTDHGNENKTAVLVMSCRKYECAWDPFFILFKRYWPDCPYKVYFGTDTGRYPGVENIEIGKDLGWANNCRYVLEQIEAERIILIFEDFLFMSRVDTERVRKYVQHSYDFSVGSLRLKACPGSTGTWYGTDCLGSIGPSDDYRVSMQIAIWQKSLLLNLMRDGWNAWQVELEGTRYAAARPEPFISVKPNDPPVIDYYSTAITKGVWEDNALLMLDREGIPRQHIPKYVK